MHKNSVSIIKCAVIVALLTIGVLIAISYIKFFWLSTLDLPKGDHWRYLAQLIKYIDGQRSLWHFLSSDFYTLSHSHIVTLGVVLGNYYLFDLRYDLEAYIGLLSVAVLAIFIIYRFYVMHIHSSSPLILGSALVAFIAVLLNPHNVVSWSLVLFEYFYLLCAVLALYWYEKLPVQGWGRSCFFIAMPFYFYLGDAMGASAILSMAVWTVLFARDTHWRHLAVSLVIVGICVYSVSVLLPDMRPHTKVGKLDALEYLVSHPLQAIQFILNLYSQGLVAYQYVAKLFPENGALVQQLIGLLLLSFQLGAVFVAVRFRHLVSGQLPLLLIIFTAISAVGILLSRLPEFGPTYGVNYAFGLRYVRLFQLGMVGALWIYFSIWINSTDKNLLSHLGLKLAMIIVFVCLLVSSYYSHQYFWNLIPSAQRHNERVVIMFKRAANGSDIDLGAADPRCAKNFCDKQLAFLKQQRLSIFREEHLLDASK